MDPLVDPKIILFLKVYILVINLPYFFFFYHEFHILSAMQLRLLPGFLALAGKIVLKGPLDMMEPLGKLK